MSFAKKYPFLFLYALLAVGIFGGSLFLYLKSSSEYDKGLKKLKRITSSYNQLAELDPSPVEANIEAAENNANDLRLQLEQLRISLQSNQRVQSDTNVKGIEVLGKVQGFILDMEKVAKRAGVAYTEGEAFGLARFSGRAVPPADAYAPQISRQIDILRYLIEVTCQSNPSKLILVEREAIMPAVDNKEGVEDVFVVDPAVTAAVAGSIDTTAFKVSFQGYTESLRAFLNRIADFELPIVVREITVDPVAVAPKDSRRRNRSKSQVDIDTLFNNLFDSNADGSESSSTSVSPASNASLEPVVENNQSTFTIVLEYIEVVVEGRATASAGE